MPHGHVSCAHTGDGWYKPVVGPTGLHDDLVGPAWPFGFGNTMKTERKSERVNPCHVVLDPSDLNLDLELDLNLHADFFHFLDRKIYDIM